MGACQRKRMINKMTARMCHAEPPSLGGHQLGYTGLGLLSPRSKSATESRIDDLVLRSFLVKGSFASTQPLTTTFVHRSPAHA